MYKRIISLPDVFNCMRACVCVCAFVVRVYIVQEISSKRLHLCYIYQTKEYIIVM